MPYPLNPTTGDEYILGQKTWKYNGSRWVKLGLSQTVSADVAFSDLTSTPTTLAGYGITDVAFSYLTSTPTTIAGYGITDALALGTTGTTALAGNSVLTDLSITDGTSGQVLTTDGSGGFTFTSASSSTTLGAVGTYAFMARNTTSQTAYISTGSVYSGSSLVYSGFTRSAGNNIGTANGSTASGTWQSMGNVGAFFSGFNVRATLFVRIS